MRCTVVSGNQNYEFYYRISSFICFLVFLQLPYTKLLGCAFHYNQALYRNIQAKGLQDAVVSKLKVEFNYSTIASTIQLLAFHYQCFPKHFTKEFSSVESSNLMLILINY